MTGSAHCCLGPYWQRRLGKNELTAIQRSAREGELHLHVLESGIVISGQAVTTLRGELIV
uniref:PhzF family phenazine biosynthesis protein n=1 Tax=Paenibacillus cymbidii TaxID=1639034 RepID=UPI002E256F71